MDIKKSGICKWYSVQNGYGFIIPDEGGPDVFLHAKELEKANARDLEDGTPVLYLEKIRDNGKVAAVALEIVD